MPENASAPVAPPGAQIVMEFWDRDHTVDADGHIYSASVPYIVIGFDDEIQMLAWAQSQIPARIQPDPELNIYIELDTIAIDERIAQNVWRVIANYPHVDYNLQDGDENEIPEFSMDISGGTKHITHSKETVASYSADESPAPDYQRAINVSQENKVDGVDIVNCSFSFTEKHYYTDRKMSNDFKRTIASLVGKVNSVSFRQWEPGELLFMGATGSRRGKTAKDKWEVTFRFAVSMNATDISISETITIPEKKGWDYLWVKYADDVDKNTLVKTIQAAYVERVYDYESFSPLK